MKLCLLTNSALLLLLELSFQPTVYSTGIYRNLLSQDHILPYCLSPKHAPDTLFIVAEEDWRLQASDCVPLEDTDAYRRYEEAMSMTNARRASNLAASSSSAEPVAALAPPSPGYWEPLPDADYNFDDQGLEAVYVPVMEDEDAGPAAEPVAAAGEPDEWLRRTLKPMTKEVNFPQSLKDVVRICTQAHRIGYGDFVWLSWDGITSKRKMHPSHATTAFGLTQTGARLLLEMFQAEVAPGHIDHLFKQRLYDDWWGGRMRACYVCKTIGGYVSHHSDVDLEGRENNFNAPWVQSGTRGGTERTLRRIQPENTHVLRRIKEDTVLDGEAFLWQTLRAEGDWDPDLALRIPRYDPGLTNAIENQEVPREMTARSKRAMRGHRHGASFRHWTDNPDEAGRVQYKQTPAI